MLIRNTAERFGLVARTLHWLTLLLLIGSFTLAISMVNMPFSPRKLEFYSWHKWVGVTIFLVVLLRLGWRLANPVPRQPPDTPRWQQRLARLSHAALYAILIRCRSNHQARRDGSSASPGCLTLRSTRS